MITLPGLAVSSWCYNGTQAWCPDCTKFTYQSWSWQATSYWSISASYNPHFCKAEI